ncbi:hypothetical protein CASFOL_004091 [Castilleja foliolosa]|uniref:LOB domain-containing protein n=1 Tax=Castilleja foliolosa TaxID=1961234 RepID=A0ABD3EJF5_9LAMI
MSCNGCRALRKGCADGCTLRPCLQWINSPESQVNATLFLAKYYGRAGLINLINVGPTHRRPVRDGARSRIREIFRSLLYEACGRIIHPVHGSVGLMSSGNWPQCQAAVEAVLNGGSPQFSGHNNESVVTLGRARARIRSKRSCRSEVNSVVTGLTSEPEAKFTISGWDYENDDQELNRAASHDSFSVETVEPASVNRDWEPVWGIKPESEPSEIELELTLGLNHVHQTYMSTTVIDISDSE